MSEHRLGREFVPLRDLALKTFLLANSSVSVLLDYSVSVLEEVSTTERETS